jgi:MauM/NapG family ferredoxin protein
MSFHKITRTCTLGAFIILLFFAAYPYPDGLATNVFLRLDPLVAVGTFIATRSLIVDLLPGVVILIAVLFLGRFFCGHICPMGSTLDALEVLVQRKKVKAKGGSYESNARFRSWKYLGLLGILGAAVSGVSLVFIGSPISLVTRLYGLVLDPVLLLLGDAGLMFVAPLASKAGFPNLAYMNIVPRFFATNFFVFLMFVAIIGLAYIQPRFWCRNLCPAGALMGVFSRRPLVRRHVSDFCTGCGRCVRECPVSAISENPKQTSHSECIVCLRCTKVCPESAVFFSWMKAPEEAGVRPADPTRRGILLGLGSGLMSAGLLHTSIDQPNLLFKDEVLTDPELIRPPGSTPEPEFLAKCIRCGECMKACPTNTLQPVWLKAGLEGIFTPKAVLRFAGCARHCNLCGKVCPTGAIRDLQLAEKNHAKMGTASVRHQDCLVWEQDKKCLVCYEVCPYSAISLKTIPGSRNAAPLVFADKCLGCGWCESRCPVTGAAAIRVSIIGELRLSTGSYVGKARELGFVFKPKTKSNNRISPGTFHAPEATKNQNNQGKAVPSTNGLPPGFDPK